MSTRETLTAFVEAINRRDSRALDALLGEDHVFIDGLDTRISGRARALEAWRLFFSWFPDYRIEIEDVAEGKKGLFLLSGRAKGTYAPGGQKPAPENAFDIPAAWKAVVRGGTLKLWQVYSDTGPIREIVDRVSGRP